MSVGHKRSWITRLAPYWRRQPWTIAAALLLAVGGQGLLGLLPLVQRAAVDQGLPGGTAAVLPWALLLLVGGILSYLMQYVRRVLSSVIAGRLQHQLRLALHTAALHRDRGQADRFSVGDAMVRAGTDLQLLTQFVAQIPLLTAHGVLLLTAIVGMIVLDPLLALLSLLWIPLFLVLAWRFRDRAYPSSWVDQRNTVKVAETIDESIGGVRLVRAFSQQHARNARVEAESESLFSSRMRTARYSSMFASILQAMPFLGQMVALVAGGILAINGHITVGVILAFLTWLVQIIAPVRLLSGLVLSSQQARTGAGRILELLDHEPAVPPGPPTPLALPAGAVGVEVDSVVYRHGDGRSVFEGLSLSVAPGERLAVVGASASGKSTLALLVARQLAAQSGVVRIGGVDSRSVSLDSYRDQVGIVFDESILFEGSIRDNITLGDDRISDADVEAVTQIAQAHDFIMATADGYDTMVGERGYTLSGGQRQRIALARALLRRPRLLILDDATSAIDARTEAAIFDRLEAALTGITTIVVANRESTLRLVDRVVMLDDGRVAEEGAHDELVRRSDHYRALISGLGVELGSLAEAFGGHGPAAQGDHAVQGVISSATGGSSSNGILGVGRRVATVDQRLLDRVARLREATDVVDQRSRLGAGAAERSIGQLVRRFTAVLAIAIVLLVLDAATTSLVAPLLVRLGVDTGVLAGDVPRLLVIGAVFLAAIVVSAVITRFSQLHLARLAENVLFALRVRIFAKLQRLSLAYYDRTSGGRILTSVTTDLDAISSLLQVGLQTALVGAATAAGVVVALLIQDWRLALPGLSTVVVLAVVTWLYWRGASRAHRDARTHIAAVNAYLHESLSAAHVVQSLGAGRRRHTRFEQLSTAHIDARLRSQHLLAMQFPLPQVLATAAKAITLLVGAAMIADGTVTLGLVVAFLLLYDQMYNPIQQVSVVLDQVMQAGAAANRIDALLADGPEEQVASGAVVPGDGSIELHDVSFRYREGLPFVLQQISLRVEPGQRVALVGTTGAGKSTVAKLMLRFYDAQAGTVLVAGAPATEQDTDVLRAGIGYVPQEPYLFAGTVAQNIAFGRPDATPEEIVAAARAVGAHEWIESLDDGYDTAVGNDRSRFSAGQRQILCLARALIRDPAVLVFDEATTNLDLRAEAIVQAAMDRAVGDRTTLVIAHRLHTARYADRIGVLDEGRLVEWGTHDELVHSHGAYARLVGAVPPPHVAVAGIQCKHDI